MSMVLLVSTGFKSSSSHGLQARERLPVENSTGVIEVVEASVGLVVASTGILSTIAIFLLLYLCFAGSSFQQGYLLVCFFQRLENSLLLRQVAHRVAIKFLSKSFVGCLSNRPGRRQLGCLLSRRTPNANRNRKDVFSDKKKKENSLLLLYFMLYLRIQQRFAFHVDSACSCNLGVTNIYTA
jgi:hypothetical protein